MHRPWKRAQVQGLKESRLTNIRGGGEDQGPVSSEEVWTNPVIKTLPPCFMLVGVQEERSEQGCRKAKHKTYRPLDDYTGSYGV